MSKNKPGKEQIPLFVVQGSEKRPSYLTWEEIEQPGPMGPHTNVVVRAERLIECLNAIAHANMLGGFDIAVNHDQYREPIEERYEEHTPLVAGNARDKVKRLEAEAFDNFWRATGFISMRGSGVKSGYVRTRTLKMWSDFNAAYGVPVEKNSDLVKYRKKLKKFLPVDHPLREQKQKKGTERYELAPSIMLV